ncbi:dephospho-CoA kinase [Sphingomicrobium clamense]|uniref:Dephospho-CoA kinase n=1 Tax=Sphingomicrobium clamense TaxID=2851013 RepID=A0ABS6V4C4_9SPHN|nr:dephospho-CoA kinase [Sphingomicrobium sp. B8]MBW0143933.1 dephospho-CoA kinase [Sphingomicrobium sp. B8]
MKTLAITGSIGMGKSTVAKMFAEAGIPTFDADATVRELQGQGGKLVPVIEQEFPGSTRDGKVDRDVLSGMVLGDRDKLAKLEAIVHPAVHHERTRFILENGDAQALLFDIPLLFETNGAENFDHVIVVSAPPEMQRERVLGRDGMTVEKYERILARQMPDEEKRERADFIVDTSGDLDETRAQVDRILSCLGLARGA